MSQTARGLAAASPRGCNLRFASCHSDLGRTRGYARGSPTASRNGRPPDNLPAASPASPNLHRTHRDGLATSAEAKQKLDDTTARSIHRQARQARATTSSTTVNEPAGAEVLAANSGPDEPRGGVRVSETNSSWVSGTTGFGRFAYASTNSRCTSRRFGATSHRGQVSETHEARNRRPPRNLREWDVSCKLGA